MSFIHPCFIRKNTPELRRYLQELGYKLNKGKVFGRYLVCFKTKDIGDYCFVGCPLWDLSNMPDYKGAIDCGTNEELFKAIAALRDDSDYMQWFTDGDMFELCHGIDFLKEDYTTMEFNEKRNFYHKATVEELMEKL